MVKLYCPKCQDVYTPKSSRHHHTDGAYFGTGFPHMLFMVHPEYRPKQPANKFVPRYFIFRNGTAFFGVSRVTDSVVRHGFRVWICFGSVMSVHAESVTPNSLAFVLKVICPFAQFNSLIFALPEKYMHVFLCLGC